MKLDKGVFTVSLDFELFWGVRDHRTLQDYGKNIASVHEVIPRLLKLFTEYNVHATWATVGFLFLENKKQLLAHCPAVLPAYENKSYDPYPYLKKEQLDAVYHFAPGLIKQIAATPGQEVATHTFSHFYTLEKGADSASLAADLNGAIQVAKEMGIDIKSIIFPRNQYNNEVLAVCKNAGILSFRGTENSWIYKTRSRADETLIRRLVRITDAYLKISGSNTFNILPDNGGLTNIPASQFLRPYSRKLKLFEPFRLKRIINNVDHASTNKQIFHLWWHPHNFGWQIEENFEFLQRILKHFRSLEEKGIMESLNMYELYKMKTNNG